MGKGISRIVLIAAGLAAMSLAITTSAAAKVTGNFTGTTDEIIQWASWKWGLDEDLVRAVAV